jgi:hypothetical protein
MPFMCKKRKRIQTYTQRSASLNPVENSKSGIQTKMTQWVKTQCIFTIISRISPMERFVFLKNPISVWPTMAEAFDFGLGIGDLGL